jgi:hypothetical protein
VPPLALIHQCRSWKRQEESRGVRWAELSAQSVVVLVEFSSGVTMQIAVSVGGVMVVIAAATLLMWVRIASRQQPKLLLRRSSMR